MVACKLINLGATVCQARTGFAAQPGGGIIAPPSSFNNVHHRTIVKQTIQHLLPAVLHLREAVLFGMRVLHTKASAGRGGWGGTAVRRAFAPDLGSALRWPVMRASQYRSRPF